MHSWGKKTPSLGRASRQHMPHKSKRSLQFGRKAVPLSRRWGETGRKFKKAFPVTPTQAQVQLVDPFGKTNPVETSVWYQSRFYRANLHFKGDLPYLRDITVYSDTFAQPFLNAAMRLEDVEQRLPSVLNGYHWRTDAHSRTEPDAGGFVISNVTRLVKTGKVVVKETGKYMTVFVPVQDELVLRMQFCERQLSVMLQSTSSDRILPLDLAFEWDVTSGRLQSGCLRLLYWHSWRDC
jgi:hypothetical protein